MTALGTTLRLTGFGRIIYQITVLTRWIASWSMLFWTGLLRIVQILNRITGRINFSLIHW